MEAEWTALCQGTRHAEHTRGLLNELGSHQKCVKWWCDNAATVMTATTPGHNGRTRHLDVKLKKTREMVTVGSRILHETGRLKVTETNRRVLFI